MNNHLTSFAKNRLLLNCILALLLIGNLIEYPMQGKGQNTLPQRSAFNEQMHYMDSLENKLSRAQFMDSAISYIYGNIYQNKFLSYTDLEKLLSKYHYYAFKKFSKGNYRIYYFLMLMENENVQHRYGEALFFAEKADKEILDFGDPFVYGAANYKAYMFLEAKQYEKLVSQYQNSPSNADHVFTTKGKVPSTVFDQLSNFMKFAMKAYCEIKDTAHAKQLLVQSKKLLPPLNDQYITGHRDNVSIFNLKEAILEMEFSYYFLLFKDVKATKKVVNDYYRLVYNATSGDLMVENGFHQMADIMKLQYHTLNQNFDSTKFYVEKCRISALKYGYTLYKEDYLQPEVDMYYAMGDFKKAFTVEKELIDYYMEKYGQMLLSQLDLMYTYVQADYAKRDIQKMKAEKQLRTLIWVIIVVLVLSISIFTVLKMKRAKTNLSRSLKDIKKVYELQISKLDSEKQMAVLDEQQRLGQDLHDGLSGTMAAIQQQLNGIVERERDELAIMEIDRVRKNVEEVYKTLRRKSHQLFEQKMFFFDKEFVTKMNAIIQTALPDENYAKEIVIEDAAIAAIDNGYRKSLLYILMECLTNIVKHAKATEVTIILSNTSQYNRILQVSDNGSGGKSNLHAEDSVGFKSLQKRVTEIAGTLTIIQEEGTTVMVQF